jgi:DNA-directed RNA polymerase subunit RPC12/RpoP
MKCIHCGSDSKLKDRKANDRRCTQCSHRFAFEPTTDTRKVSDGLFQRCVQEVSGDGTLFFTEKQLCYELNRRLLRKIAYIPSPFSIGAGICGAGGVVGIMMGTAILLPIGLLAGITTLIVGAAVGKKTPKPRRAIILRQEFREKYLGPYVLTHGPIEKLKGEVTGPRRPISTSAVSDMPSDLASYSFDRVLVTDDATIASMLVANRFHFENNCAILSLDGRFPENGRFAMILQMLKRNPDLTVFGIHDASIDGLQLPLLLRTEPWFPERSVRVVDLGLRPLHVMKGGFLLTTAKAALLPTEIESRLTPEEADWLKQGNVAELASLRPARLMRAIYQGFNQTNAMPAGHMGPDGVVIVGGPGYGGDPWVGDGRGADVFAADSFG